MLNKDILLKRFSEAKYIEINKIDVNIGKATSNLIENILFSNFNIAKFLLNINIYSIIYIIDDTFNFFIITNNKYPKEQILITKEKLYNDLNTNFVNRLYSLLIENFNDEKINNIISKLINKIINNTSDIINNMIIIAKSK
jgi:hypothetical protein